MKLHARTRGLIICAALSVAQLPTPAPSHGASKYYGVSKDPRGRTQGTPRPGSRPYFVWRAAIEIRRKKITLGIFDDEQDAARAVDEYLASIGRERRNFPEDEVGDPGDLGGDAVSSPQ